MSADSGNIVLEGVTTHNLKAVDVAIPKGRLVVAAGVSGSGKSSLIIDTLFEHSKSLYLGALSSNALDVGEGDYQFDRIAGTQPPVALRQRDGGYSNPRSTVGTITGLDGLYRLLFGAGAHPVCPVCLTAVPASDHRCEKCGVIVEPHTARQFSPNRKEGKCLQCDGVGEMIGFSLDKIIPDRSLTLTQIWDGADSGTFAVPNVRKALEAMAADIGLDLDTPFNALNEDQLDKVLHGSDAIYSIKVRKVTNDFRFEGILGFLDRAYKNASSAARRKAFTNYLARETCTACGGGRLRPESLKATVAGRTFANYQSDELSTATAQLDQALAGGDLPPQVRELANSIITHSRNIIEVGLGHLQLQRPVVTLSGGELQRLLLAQHLASDLTGVMYVLDEPTAGLHESDTGKILMSLRRLRDLGNTVIVIEHDESVIRSADWVIELGPGAGFRGGEIVFQGTVANLLRDPHSPTCAALTSEPPTRKAADLDRSQWLQVSDIRRNNIVGEEIKFPLEALTCVTGVSGAGKSSLVANVHEAIAQAVAKGTDVGGRVSGAGALEDVIYIEQRPIGRSSRSTLATYIGISDNIRDEFANSTAAQELGLERTDFSTNVAGGRCETCKGLGLAEVGMSLFRSEFVVCPECDGQRFQDHVLEVRVSDKNIFDVLSMAVEDALDWFQQNGSSKIVQALSVLKDFGLGYLQLGCTTTTLSGGEAQRLNLASELLKQRRSGTLFIFNEPTRGLHTADIQHLLRLFERLLSTGNSILAIEHNIRVISIADWVIDLGPGAGREGGHVVHCGTAQSLADNPESITGQYVRAHLGSDHDPGSTKDVQQQAPAVDTSIGIQQLAAILPQVTSVVTGMADGESAENPRGLAIGSLILLPDTDRTIGFVVKARSSSWAAIANAGHFCVNLLAEGQDDLIEAFSRHRPDTRFASLAWEPSGNRCPRLAGAYGVIDCGLQAHYLMGDHLLVLAKAIRITIDPDAPGPLLRPDAANGAEIGYGWNHYTERSKVV